MEYKKVIIDMINKINNDKLLERIYHFVEHFYVSN